MGVEGVKRYKVPVMRQISSGDVMYSMVTVVNNTLVYLKVAKGIDLKSSHPKGKKL